MISLLLSVGFPFLLVGMLLGVMGMAFIIRERRRRADQERALRESSLSRTIKLSRMRKPRHGLSDREINQVLACEMELWWERHHTVKRPS